MPAERTAHHPFMSTGQYDYKVDYENNRLVNLDGKVILSGDTLPYSSERWIIENAARFLRTILYMNAGIPDLTMTLEHKDELSSVFSDAYYAGLDPIGISESNPPVDRREYLIRELAKEMLTKPMPEDAEQYLKHKEYGLALEAVSREIMEK